MLHTWKAVVLVTFALPIFSSCGDNPVGPTVQSVSGDYTATTFTITPAGANPINALQEGFSLDISLLADGKTTGRVFIPAFLDEDGRAHEEPLRGTWRLQGSTVEFDFPNADIYVEDVPFTVDGGRLTNDYVLGGNAARLVLTKD